MRSYPSWIAGLRYKSPQGLNRAKFCWLNLAPGCDLQLVPEPDNPNGDHAVAVMLGRFHLGYIPQEHAWVFRAIREEGAIIRCTVGRIDTWGWIFTRAKHVHLVLTVVGHDASLIVDD